MIVTRLIPRLNVFFRVSGSHQYQCKSVNNAIQHCRSTGFITNHTQRYSTSATDNREPPKQWTVLEPELEDFLIPRKLSVTPLESWLSLRYSLPPLLEAPVPLDGGDLIEEAVVLPPSAVPVLEDGEDGATPLSCKNVLEIRRRKMNRHKYKKLLKRTKFLRRRIKERRQKRKQSRFEKDLMRIWRRAGLKKAPEGWTTPKIYVTHQVKRR